MSEGSSKKKLLPAWAPLILVPPPTGTQKIRILLFLLLYTLTTQPHRTVPSLSLSSSLFVLLPSPLSFPSLSHLKHLFLYIYFNSVIEDIKHTPLVQLSSSRRHTNPFQNISSSDPISILSRFFLSVNKTCFEQRITVIIMVIKLTHGD